MKANIKVIHKYKNLPVTIKSSFWFTVCNFFQKGILFITVPIFSRLLSAQQYGICSVFQSWMTIITIFATLNISDSAFNVGLLKYEKDRDSYVSSMIGLSSLASIIVLIIYITFYQYWKNLIQLEPYLVIMMLIELFLYPAYIFWTLKERFVYKYKALIGVTISITLLAQIIGIWAVVHYGYTSDAKLISNSIINICFYLIIYILLIAKGKKIFDKYYWKFALSFCIPLLPHFLSIVLLSQCDKIMINNLYGPEGAGIYTIAFSVSSALSILTISINSSLIPWTYNSLKTGNYKEIKKVNNICTFMVSCIIILIIMFAPEIISIMAPSEYKMSVWIIPPLVLSLFFNWIYTLICNIELYYEKKMFIMIVSVFIALLKIILNLLLIGKYGYISASYTTLFCYILLALFHYFYMYKNLKKQMDNNIIFNNKVIILLSIGVISFTALLMLFYNLTYIRYTLIVVFLLLIFLFRNKFSPIIAKVWKKDLV